jgi:hypothetical protein
MTGADLPDPALELPLGADRSDGGRHADVDSRNVLLRELRAHFHVAAEREPEQPARPRADDLADLDASAEDEAAGRGTYVEAPDPGSGRAQLRLCDPDPGRRGVVRRLPAIDIGGRNEPAAHQRLSALQLVLRELGVGAGDLHLRGQLSGFLGLDGPLDGCQHLALADPASRIDENPGDLAAFAGDSDRLVAPGGERTASRYDSRPGCVPER